MVGAGTRVLELRAKEERFRFVDIPVRPVPSLLRGFSAPVKVGYGYNDEEIMFLMAHDSDGFNRWDAAQTLAQRILMALVSKPGADVPDGFLTAFRRALLDREADKRLLAEVLSLPTESYLGDQMKTVDVDGIHRARERLRGYLGGRLRDELAAVFQENRETGPYDLEPASVGRRALKNLCLGYLVQAGDAHALRWCQDQFAENRNMTDVVTALRLLVDEGGAVAEAATRDFYTRWAGDPLVLDKWFAVQATSKRADTLAKVTELLQHPAFSITNPNRVRSLIGAFAAGNQVRFHAADGAGYRFLTERVLELDPINPQIASRLLQCLTRWRRFDAHRQTLMRAEARARVGRGGTLEGCLRSRLQESRGYVSLVPIRR